MRQRPAEYIPQIPEQFLLRPQEADEITWPKCARRTSTCYPVETNPPPHCQLHATFMPQCICIASGEGAWPVYLAGNTSNQFSANLMHKGHAQIRRQSPPLSLMYFIIEFNAKTRVPYITLSHRVVFCLGAEGSYHSWNFI